MSVRLTEPAIARAVRGAAANKQRRDLSDLGCEGLRLRLTPNGGKAWVLACRDQRGAMRRFALGTYPVMGIAAARDAARALHARVKHENADPIAEARKQRAHAVEAKAGIGTLASVLDIYGERRGCQLKSWPHSRLRVERVFAPLLAKSVASMTVGDLQLTADRYPTPKSASFAIRALRPALKWAAQPGRAYVAKDLCDLHEPTTPARRQRVLSGDELARVLPAMRQSRATHARAMRFMLLTLARLEEVCEATWQEIDLTAATWTLPAARTKNGQPHVIPLSRQAITLLRSQMGIVGVASNNSDISRLDSSRPIVSPAALIFASDQRTPLGNWDRENKKVHALSHTSGWHRHDLRRTGATLLGEAGIMPPIIEAALNHTHVGSALAATYNRSRYRPEVAAALQTLGDLLDAAEGVIHQVR